MKLNGSQIIVECLVEQGVDTIFGYERLADCCRYGCLQGVAGA